jgi:hypothetical protein
MNQFKKAQVIMLPIEDNSNTNIQLFGRTLEYHNILKFINKDFYKSQHLYIISDDEIKEGDWFIMNNCIVRQCKERTNTVITDILVEYEDYEQSWLFIGYKEDGSSKHSIINRLKVNPKDNTITIKKLKDSWNREEVITLIYKHTEDMFSQRIELDKWIEENL